MKATSARSASISSTIATTEPAHARPEAVRMALAIIEAMSPR
ncbi:MAG: hypothetical protein O3C34_13020 [Proteobacteria bacterium]|nr:hypothetical protein [Pseudomonadota bacterium]